jgi:predicted O-methyltransferase YrrM
MAVVEAVLREIEARAVKRRLPIIGREKGRIIAVIVDEEKPTRVIEVGTNIGYSAITIGSHMPTGSVLYTMEIDEGLAAEAVENIARAGLSDRIRVLVGDALALIPGVEGPVDLAFVDAEKDEYAGYLTIIEPKLRPGALVVADNAGIFEHAMGDYLERVRCSGLYESRYVSVGWDG